jgi:hypothetical protein
MGLQEYYSKVQHIEQTIETAYVVIVSEDTSDGGKAGLVSEVSRSTAARMIAEGRARLASPTEVQSYREPRGAKKPLRPGRG